MSTDLIEQPSTKNAIIYSVTPKTIEQMDARFALITVNGIADKAGYEAAQKARMECVKARSAIEKTRQELKQESLETGRRIDAEAKRLTALIQPIEKRLEDQQKAIDEEKVRLKQVEEDKLYAERLGAWTAAGGPKTDRAYLLSHNPEQFEVRLVEQREAKAAREQAERQAEADRLERERIAVEQAEANRIESERLAAERAEFERKQAEAAAETARLKKEQDDREWALQQESNRLATIEANRLEAIRLEQVAKEAEERGRLEAEQRIEQERQQTEARRVAEEAAAKRAAALLPVKQKLEVFANDLLNIATPDLEPDVEANLYSIINAAVESVRCMARKLA